MDYLLHKYQPLINRIYAQYKDNFVNFIGEEAYKSYNKETSSGIAPDDFAQDDLRSYIEEQFLRLVLEYDPSGSVDFPGYVSAKLPKRVSGSYVHAHYRNIGREQLSYKEDGVDQMKDSEGYNPRLEKEVINNLLDELVGINLLIFEMLIDKNHEYSTFSIFSQCRNNYPSLEKSDFNKRLSYIKGRAIENISEINQKG